MSCSSVGGHPWVTLGLPEKRGEAGERRKVPGDHVFRCLLGFAALKGYQHEKSPPPVLTEILTPANIKSQEP